MKTMIKLTLTVIMTLGFLSAQSYLTDYNYLYGNNSSAYSNNSSYSTLNSTSNSYSNPYVAGNGDVKGWDNDGDGRLEPTYVKSYTKSDGTFVRSHYRAKPSRY